MKTGLFLQCRLDSSRLPGKALMNLQGKKVIQLCMESLYEVNEVIPVLLTTHEDFDTLEPLAKQSGFHCFAGSKEDVLQRFLNGAEHFQVDTILRATGDNPLVSAKLAQRILEEHIKEAAHYSGFLGIPLGTGVEILDVHALKEAQESSDDPYDHEHVSPFLYKNPQRFNIYRPNLEGTYGWAHEKVSLDTLEDWEKLEGIFRALYRGNPIEIESLIDYLREIHG